MANRRWLERCSYKIYGLRQKHNIDRDSVFDWKWAENIARNTKRSEQSSWGREDDELVEEMFSRFLSHRQKEENSYKHSSSYKYPDSSLDFTPIGTLFPTIFNPAIFG